jgi:hypothetical protein
MCSLSNNTKSIPFSQTQGRGWGCGHRITSNHSNVKVSSSEILCSLLSLIDLGSQPSVHMADGFRVKYGPPHVLNEQYLLYFSRHHTPTMVSPVAYRSSVTSAPTPLRFVDAGANVSLEAHRSAFLKGTLQLHSTAQPHSC